MLSFQIFQNLEFFIQLFFSRLEFVVLKNKIAKSLCPLSPLFFSVIKKSRIMCQRFSVMEISLQSLVIYLQCDGSLKGGGREKGVG